MTLLGYTVSTKTPVDLSAADKRQGTYVLGLNGTGKTSLLLCIALQDMYSGDGLCVLDSHGDLT